jgi:purine-binding chemotaxis protein CheW
VLDLRPQDIEPPPDFGTQVSIDYLIGIGKVDMKFVLILDIDRVLSMNELASAATLGGNGEQEA